LFASEGVLRDEDFKGVVPRTTPTRENFTTGGGIGATTMLIAELGGPARFASAGTLTALCSAVSGTPAFRQTSNEKFHAQLDGQSAATVPSIFIW
jgi:hypothetical protein